MNQRFGGRPPHLLPAPPPPELPTELPHFQKNGEGSASLRLPPNPNPGMLLCSCLLHSCLLRSCLLHSCLLHSCLLPPASCTPASGSLLLSSALRHSCLHLGVLIEVTTCWADNISEARVLREHSERVRETVREKWCVRERVRECASE
jgi:hypothetical protein